MPEFADTLAQLVMLLLELLADLARFALRWALVIAWAVWWLWAVDWRRLWPTLARGAWAPVVLLALTAALVWARLEPGPYQLWGLWVPSFWWHLVAVALLLATAAFAGWLQLVYRWSPAEIDLEPPPVEHHDDHGHAPAHH